MNQPLVPDDFVVPEVYDTDSFRFELLGPRHNEADHAAWTSSIPHIRATPGFSGHWPPPEGMTMDENLADLRSHEDRSARGVDFAYSVLDPATGDVIGCVYLKPVSTVEDVREVAALSWVTADRAAQDTRLTEVVGAWLVAAWPFSSVRYRRGREPVVLRKD